MHFNFAEWTNVLFKQMLSNQLKKKTSFIEKVSGVHFTWQWQIHYD